MCMVNCCVLLHWCVYVLWTDVVVMPAAVFIHAAFVFLFFGSFVLVLLCTLVTHQLGAWSWC